MSQYSNQNTSSQTSPLKKLSKVSARYIEIDSFKNSDTHRGYFCYNCIYFIKPNHCSLVTDEGPDVFNKSSNEIAPHGICSIWNPNEKEINENDSQGQSNSINNTVGVSTFSCENCDEKFKTREELKQHNINDHKKRE